MKASCSWRTGKGDRPCPPNTLKKFVAAAAQAAGVDDTAWVSAVFLSPEKMTELNMAALGHTGATDVISFDYRTAGIPGTGDVPDVEIYVCPAVARREAEKRNLPYARETALYLVHGFLHIAGEDDLRPDLKRKMRRAEKRTLAALAENFDFERIFGQ